MRILKLLSIFCFLVSLPVNGFSEAKYEEGKLFGRVKTEYAASFSSSEILKRVKLTQYRLNTVEKAFIINEDPLNRIYLIEFSANEKTDALIEVLMATGIFEYVEKVALYTTSFTPNDLHSAQWNLKKIMAENAWDVKKGNPNIIIAMVDDAVDTAHPDLEPVVWRNKNEIRGNGVDDDANGYIDDYIGWDVADNDNDPTPGGSLNHGTHCAGISGAATHNSKGIASIGFGCRLMAIKTGRAGYNYLFSPYKGVEYAIINNAKVISMSWGGGGYSNSYQALFDNAYKKGIVCVAAAGNDSVSYAHYPSAYNHVIAVGSTNSADEASYFSNYGTWVDVMAPGSSIYSTLPNNKYGYMSGTSMACPLVSGLCGLMFSLNPNATPDQIEACLKSGCENIDAYQSKKYLKKYLGKMGAGRINAENSMKCLKSINADFTSNLTSTCPGDTISFFDKSQPKPVALKWRFPGGTPATSFASNPKIKYAAAGTYDVELIVFDSTKSDTILRKNLITIAVPKATISVNRTILKGNTTTVKVDFTGTAPFKVTIFDGTSSKVISNIGNTPYYYSVSPVVTTTYTITAYNDKKCSGTFSGSAKVTVLSTITNCTNGLRYQASFGGSSEDYAYALTEDDAGNVYISGNTQNFGSGDGYFAKFNNQGNMVWFKTYGGNSNDLFQKHIKTPDNGFLLVGSTSSYGAGGSDAWIVKVDSSGSVQWSRTVGGSGSELAWNAAVNFDNGYLVYGHTNTYGAGDMDNYIIRLDKNGNIKWSKSYGNSYYSLITGLATYADGSAIFCANYRTSTDGDPLVAKIDSLGNLLWSKRFGGSDNDGIQGLAKGNNGNVYIAGYYRPNSSNQEMLVACFTPSGTNKWIKTYNGSGNEAVYNIEMDGEEILLNGHTNSYGSGAADASILKIDTSGNLIFAKAIGGTGDEIFFSCLKSIDQGYYSVGHTKSFTNGANDIFLNKFTCKPFLGCNEKDFSPSTSNLSLTIYNESQATSAGGTLNTQNITATKRSINVSYQCKTLPNSINGYNCLKVENYSKISSTNAGFTGVLDNSDYFGQVIRNIGDFDGDGVEDIGVGAELDDDGGTNLGAAYIILLKRDGSIKSKQKISATSGGFSGSLSTHNYFGSGIARLKDLNGDGINDLVVGHIYDNTVNTRSGAVWILFLNANGTVKSHQKIANGVGGFPSILDADDNFGCDVNELGDMDGDGNTDILVGAPYDDDGGTDRGAVYIIYLNSNGTVKSYKKISSTSGGFSGSIANGDVFGYGVSTATDINNDGYYDLAVSSPYDDDGGTDRGAVWLIHLDKNGAAKSHIKISSTAQSRLSTTLDNSDLLGWRVSYLNDIDNDGNIEILSGAMLDDDGGTDRGAAYIFNLGDTCKSACLKISLQSKVSATQSGFTGTLANGDGFGGGVNGIGDIDKDGINDMAVCAPADDDGGTNVGAVWILFMKSDGTVRTQQKISSSAGGFGGSITNGNYFGNRIVSVGDLNSDGVSDIAVSQHFDNNYTTRAGAVWILFLNTNGTVKSYQKITSGVGGFTATLQADDRFGLGLENIGDFDGDGVVDLLAGAQEDKDGGSAKGAFYILYLKTNGTIKGYSKISATSGNFTGTLNSIDRFGFSLTTPGDMNKDGIMDFVVGSRDDGNGGPYRGAIWTLFMNANGTVKSSVKNSSTTGTLTGIKDNDQFGHDMRTIDDLDNDGINEIVVSAPFDDDGGTDRGAVWIVYLNSNGLIKKQLKVSSSSNIMNGKLDNSDLFGYGLGVLNDMNGDGQKEIAVGAYFDDDGGADRGAVYIIKYNDTCAPAPVKTACRLRADFNYRLGCVGDTILFTDVSIDSAKAGIIKWKWSFGDGGTFEGKPVVGHAYNAAASYFVKLVVYTNGNATCADSTIRQVKMSNQFRLIGRLDDTICMADSTQLGIGATLCGAKPFTYLWQPANGLSNNKLLNPMASPGGTTRYILTITDKNNVKAYDTLMVRVDSNCCRSYANFIISNLESCVNDTFFMSNQSIVKAGATYTWKVTAGGNYTTYSGKNPPPLVFTKTGVYKLMLILNDLCGTDTMTKELIVFPKPIVEAGSDTTLCLGDSLQIGPEAFGRNTYTWSPATGLSDNNMSRPIAYFSKSITYTLKMVTEQGCIATDTIRINKVTEPKLYIGPDTSLCADTSFRLYSNISAKSYLWNNGSVQASLKITGSGTYWLEVKNTCTQRDTAKVTILGLPNFSLGRDTILCQTTSYLLKPDINTSSYIKKWDNGAGTDNRTVTQNGTYWLTLSNGNCSVIDSINIKFSKLPFAYLGPDTVICSNTVIQVNASDTNASSYLWNDGITTPIRQLSLPGRYMVTLSNICGTYKASINIGTQKPPIPDLGEKVLICYGDTTFLDATNPDTKYYLWSTGSVKPIIFVSVPGKYTVRLGNICGDFDTSVMVENKKCDCEIFVPNTFTPSITAGLNDVFKPVIPFTCEPSYYQMNIYNRWGELLFTTRDYNEGWNGEYKGKKVSFGDYVWIITYQHPFMNHGNILRKTGNVLMIDE